MTEMDFVELETLADEGTAGGYGRGGTRHADGRTQDALWPMAMEPERDGVPPLPEHLRKGSPFRRLTAVYAGRLYAFSDGASLCADGRTASRLTVQALAKAYYSAPLEIEDLEERLREAIWEAHREVAAWDKKLFCWRKDRHEDGREHHFLASEVQHSDLPRCPLCGEPVAGLQATLVAAVLRGQELALLSIGDSWALRLQKESREVDILLPPQKNRFIGMPGLDETALRVKRLHLEPGDRVMLCSDGVIDLLQDSHGDGWLEKMAEAFADEQSPAEQTRRLIENLKDRQRTAGAESRGLDDDLTILMVTVPDVANLNTLNTVARHLLSMSRRRDAVTNRDVLRGKLEEALLHTFDRGLLSDYENLLSADERAFIQTARRVSAESQDRTEAGQLVIPRSEVSPSRHPTAGTPDVKPPSSSFEMPQVKPPTKAAEGGEAQDRNMDQPSSPMPNRQRTEPVKEQLPTRLSFPDAVKAAEVRAALERGDSQTALRALENTPDRLDAPPEWAKIQAWAAFLELAAYVRAGDMKGALAACDRWPTALEQQLEQPSGNVLRRQLLIYREDPAKIVPLDVAAVRELVFADGERVTIGSQPDERKPTPGPGPNPAPPVVSAPERLVHQALQQGAQGQFAAAAQTLEQIADLEAWHLDTATLQEGLRAHDGMKGKGFSRKKDKYPELSSAPSPANIALVDLRAALKAAGVLMQQFGRACALSPTDEYLGWTQAQLDQLPVHPLWKWFPPQLLANQQALLPMLLRARVAAGAGRWGEALSALNGHSTDYGPHARTLEEARARYFAAYLEAACTAPALAIDLESLPWLGSAPDYAVLKGLWNAAQAVQAARAGNPAAWLDATNWVHEANPKFQKLQQLYLERAWKALVQPHPTIPEEGWQPLLAAAQQLVRRSVDVTLSRRKALAYWLEFLFMRFQHKDDKASLRTGYSALKELWALGLPDTRSTIETYFWELSVEALRQPEDTRVYSDARLREDSQQLLQLPGSPVLHVSARVLAAVQAVRTRRSWEWEWPLAAKPLIAALEEEQSLPLERRVDLERALWEYYIQPWSQSLSLERPLRWWQFRRRRYLRRLEVCSDYQPQTPAVARHFDALRQTLAAPSSGEDSGSRLLQVIVVAMCLPVIFACFYFILDDYLGISLLGRITPPSTTESATHIAVSPPVITTTVPQATTPPVATPSEAAPTAVATATPTATPAAMPTATSTPLIVGSPLHLEQPVIVGLVPQSLYGRSVWLLLKDWGYVAVDQGEEFRFLNDLTRQITGNPADELGGYISYGWLPQELFLYFVLAGPVHWEGETAVLVVPDFPVLELYTAAGAGALSPETLSDGTWVWGLGRAPELAQAVRDCRVEATKPGIEDILCAPPAPAAGNYLIFEPEFLIGVNANGWTGDPLLDTGRELAGWVFTDLGDDGLLRAMGSYERDAIRDRAIGREYAIFDMVWRPGKWQQAETLELKHFFVADSTGIYRHVPLE